MKIISFCPMIRWWYSVVVIRTRCEGLYPTRDFYWLLHHDCFTIYELIFKYVCHIVAIFRCKTILFGLSWAISINCFKRNKITIISYLKDLGFAFLPRILDIFISTESILDICLNVSKSIRHNFWKFCVSCLRTCSKDRMNDVK